eukprot:m.178800 g.178800  ORF g.178800 m.178800 type:complete len:176 (-) comp13560_c1_seq16:314-841(-)
MYEQVRSTCMRPFSLFFFLLLKPQSVSSHRLLKVNEGIANADFDTGDNDHHRFCTTSNYWGEGTHRRFAWMFSIQNINRTVTVDMLVSVNEHNLLKAPTQCMERKSAVKSLLSVIPQQAHIKPPTSSSLKVREFAELTKGIRKERFIFGVNLYKTALFPNEKSNMEIVIDSITMA